MINVWDYNLSFMDVYCHGKEIQESIKGEIIEEIYIISKLRE